MSRKLPRIVSRQKKSGKHHHYENRNQDGSGHFLQGLTARSARKVRPARSASELAASITRETTRVTLTMRADHDSALHAKRAGPYLEESQSASMGMAAPKEMANDTPRSARSGGAASGENMTEEDARLPNPLARAAST